MTVVQRDGVIRPDWPAPARVRAASTLRVGGVSRGPYASLNLGAGVGDEAANVARNRRILRERLGLPAEPIWLLQVHGTTVLDLDDGDLLGAEVPVGLGATAPGEPSSPKPLIAAPVPTAAPAPTADPAPTTDPAPVADGAATSRPGLPCAVLTADCLPVLLCDTSGTRVAAAHAGWRGLASGVLESAVRRLGVDPGRLMAWVGPGIGREAYEVGEDVRERFVASDPVSAGCFTADASGRWRADLHGLARLRLRTAGVEMIYGGGWCTRSEPGRFFSHRRQSPCGRMATMIWMD